jgi:NADPH-dependent 2,4-dienoyl-CoA reductase/sulfur reductase-like enzyme
MSYDMSYEPSKDHFVVIGNGPAGQQAALTLREQAPEARVTVLTRDHESCYRPHLLPELLAGTLAESSVFACSPESYGESGIKLRTGQTVIHLDPSGRTLTLDHKEVIAFTGLIIAVGGTPRIPETLAPFRDLMLTLKTLTDAGVWRKRLTTVESILLLGGDLTSFAVARALLRLNKRVTFAMNEDAFWPLRFSASLADEAAHKLTEMGAEVVRGRRVKGMSSLRDGQIEVQLDEDRVKAGLVGAFFGLVPDVRFLARSGLKIDRGIIVDEHLFTGIDAIYATGDCAQIYHPEIREYWVSIGHENATALGRIAAKNLCGQIVEARAPMENLFEVEGVKVNTSWWKSF